MADKEKDIFKKIEERQNKFFTDIEEESNRAGSLPEQEQMEAFDKIRKARSQATQMFRKQYELAGQGIDPFKDEEEDKNKQGALNFVLDILGKPISALSYGVEGLLGNDLALEKAKKSLTPFYETITGEDVPLRTFKDVLETAGLPQGGSLSEVIPQLYSETGEGTALKKGGFLDPTARGAAGFGIDLIADPLNFLPIGKAVKGIGKLANVGSQALLKKSIREAVYDIPALGKMARGFNKFALLSRTPELQGKAEKAFREFVDTQARINPEEVNRVAKMFSDPEVLGNDAVFQSLADLDDFTRLVEKGDMQEIQRVFPQQINLALKETEQGVKFKPDEFLNVYVAENKLTPKQLLAAKEVRNFLDYEAFQKAKLSVRLEKGIVQPTTEEVSKFMSKEMLRNYLPRDMVKLNILDDLSPEYIAGLSPDQRQVIENLIIKRGMEQTEGLTMKSINLSDQVRGSLPHKHRLYGSFASASNHAVALMGNINRSIPELLFKASSRRRKAEAFQSLNESLTEVFGKNNKFWPKQVKDAITQVSKKPGIDSTKFFTKAWNKYLLNPLKYSLTMPFPAYHVRNIIDDTFRGWEKFGLNWVDSEASKNAAQILTQGHHVVGLGNGLSMTAEDLFSKFTNLGVYKHSLQRADIEHSIKSALKQVQEAPDSVRAKIRNAAGWLPVSETFALKFNNHARIKGALVSLKDTIKNKGIKSLDSVDFDEALLKAAKDSKDAFVDVADLGPVDDFLAQLIPFYRFSRKNIPFHIRQLAENPQRISKLAIARHDMQSHELSPEEEQFLLPYIKDNINLIIDQNPITGNTLLMGGTGLSIEDLNKFYGSDGLMKTIQRLTIGQAAAPLQALYGYISNTHPFFGTELDDYRAKKTYKIMHDFSPLRELVGGVTRTPVRKDPETGKVEYRYELDNPKQNFLVTTALSPLLSVVASRLPGTPGQAAAALLSPRALTTTQQLFNERIGLLEKVIRNTTGVRIDKRNLTQDKLSQMNQKFREAYIDLLGESRRLKQFYKLGLQLTEDNEEELIDSSLLFPEEEE